MKIVVNNITFQNSSPQNDLYLDNIFRLLANSHPEHQFYFLTLKNYQFTLSCKSENIKVITINNILFFKIWRNFQLPILLNKLKADIVIQANGICCLNMRIPQVLMISD